MREKRAASRSDAQNDAERAALEVFRKQQGIELYARRIELPGCSVEVDGYYENDEKVVVAEVWAHVGRAKGAQLNKVSTDVLKLALLHRFFEESKPNHVVESYVIFIDDAAASVLENQSWRAYAALELGVRAYLAPVSPQVIDAVKAAQVKQNLMNEESK